MQTTTAGDRANINPRGDQPTKHHGKFLASVNDVDVAFADPVPVGRQVLSDAGFLPAEDHVLIQLLVHGTRSIGLDEPIDLRGPGAEAFWAFQSDRVFRFTIDGRGYEWGVSKVAETQLRRIAAVPDEEILVLKRDDKDVVLADDDIVELADSGTEHLLTAKRFVTVCLDTDIEKKIPIGTYTTEELIRFLDIEDGYLLNVLDTQGQLSLLHPGQETTVKEGMRFFSQVPQGGSS